MTRVVPYFVNHFISCSLILAVIVYVTNVKVPQIIKILYRFNIAWGKPVLAFMIDIMDSCVYT